METNINDIKRLLETKNSDLAVIIGNGIHLYQKHSMGINYGLDWEGLLLKLWGNAGNNSLNKIPSGVSYTEFYDVIEMAQSNSYSQSNLFQKTTHNKDNIIRNLHLSHDATKILTEQLLSSADMPSISELSISRIKDYKKSFTELVKKSKKELTKLGIQIENLDDRECIRTLIKYLSNEGIRKVLTNNIKREISNTMLAWNNDKSIYGEGSIIYNITHRLYQLGCPILTTNYDTTFSSALGLKYLKIAPVYNIYKRLSHYTYAHQGFSDFYAWNGYFGNGDVLNYNPTNCFGVWHINGVINYPRSIKLGLCDYMGAVEKARNMIQGNDGLELFNGKYRNHWAGENTWLHIIFNKSLLIFGLALEENEVFLRWLLIQRAKYFAMYRQPHSGWYVITKNEYQKKPGKIFFLKNIGFKIVIVDSYDDIYRKIWE